MANERFSYQVVEIKSGFFGVKAQHVQDELNRLGAQGWELVSVVQTNALHALQLYVKKRS